MVQTQRNDPASMPRLSHWSPMVTSEGVFSPEECDRIATLGQGVMQGPVTGDAAGDGYRNSHIDWLRPGPDSNWVFERIFQVVGQANEQHYRMDLVGVSGPLQIAEYGPGQYYHWHLDLGNEGFSLRKLSITVQLSASESYDGGAVELLYGKEAVAMSRAQGAVMIFPSYVLHRVCEVTSGMRRSLVGWIGGPHFR